MSEKVLYEWADALGDEWRLIDGPRPMGMGFQRRSAESGWEWVPSTPRDVPDLAKAMLGLLCETRRLGALYDGERLLRERESSRLAARVVELEAENAKLRACLGEARLAMMEPHGEWKDVREAKALNMIRAEVDK